jgi:hypothetical protein
MSRTLFSLAGFQVITIGRFWVIAEGSRIEKREARQYSLLRQTVFYRFKICDEVFAKRYQSFSFNRTAFSFSSHKNLFYGSRAGFSIAVRHTSASGGGQ